jgi:hypothetical protein
VNQIIAEIAEVRLRSKPGGTETFAADRCQ